jgi:RNA polymerase sigma-70 factor (ECF subfamily)
VETIERARRGDVDALGALWRSHHHLVLRYFRGRRAPSPEDLASQTWVDVARGIHRFEGDDEDFRRWLFTIARRRLVDEQRRRARQPVDPDRSEVERDDPTASTAFDAADDLARALALVRTLPDDMADAVLLRVVADLDVATVADLMDRREGHVRVLTHRGLTRLAERTLVTGDDYGAMRTA